MNDKDLKNELTQIRDDMIKEDENKIKDVKGLSDISSKKIINKVNDKKDKGFFTRPIKAVAATLGIAIALYLIWPYILFGGGLGSSAPTSNSAQKEEKPSTAQYKDDVNNTSPPAQSKPKNNEKPSQVAPDGATSMENGIKGESYLYPTLPEDSKEKIIYSFTFNIESLDFKKTEEDLLALIEKTNSYVENADIYRQNENNTTAKYLVRVPRKNSSQFQTDVQAIGNVTYQSISSENKTKEYKDKEAEKTTLDIKEERLQELLKKADNFEDMILVEKELADIQAKKENINKDLASIDHDVDYQFFNINIESVKQISDPINEETSFFQKLGKEFNKSIEMFLRFLESLAYFITRNWIIIIAVIAVLLIVNKKIKDRKN